MVLCSLTAGGFVFGAGLIGSLFSRSLSSLVTGTLFGGAILVLSACSVKIWRREKSSLPFILEQAGKFSSMLSFLSPYIYIYIFCYIICCNVIYLCFKSTTYWLQKLFCIISLNDCKKGTAFGFGHLIYLIAEANQI